MSVKTDTTEAKAQLLESYTQCIEGLTWSLERAKAYVQKFDETLTQSIQLRGKHVPFDTHENSIKAIDSFCHLMPSGSEVGNYYAVDLGGTNLRAVCVKLSGKGQNESIQKTMNIRESHVTAETPKGLLDKNCPAVSMFDTIAKLTKALIIECGDDPADKRPVSFTFSFPTQQFSLSNGTLIGWTKEFETGCNTNDPVEHQDVAELLNASFHRTDMGAFVGAVANDTVGTLLSAGYENNFSLPTTRIGIILGTGFNIASYDPSTVQNSYTGTIVNWECGNYSGGAEFASMIDMELDYSSTSRGQQLAEKMIAGHYLGELCRLAFLKVFQFRCPQNTWKRWSFGTEQASQIYNDNSKRYKITQQLLKTQFGWTLTDEEHLRMVYKLVCAVFDRSATVSALQVSVMADRTRYLQNALGGVTVGVDGSLYLKNPKYQKTFRRTIDRLLASRAELLHVVAANDGSGKGAAVIAACQANHKKH